MSADNNRIFHVDDIAHDDSKIQQKAQHLAGQPPLFVSYRETTNHPQCKCNVTLDAWKKGSDFETPDEHVCAILIDKGASGGTVRIFNDPVSNVVTGQQKRIVMAIVEPEVSCRIFGGPSVQYIRRY